MLRRFPWLVGSIALALGCGGSPPAPVSPSAHPATVENDSAAGEQLPDAELDTTATGQDEAHDSGESTTTPNQTEPAPDPFADLTHLPDKESGRHQLAAADVKELISHYRPHMREMCWIPRLNESPQGADTARVAIEVEVTSKGEVKSVRAVGGKGYEGLSDCVREHVEHWRFPRASQSSSLMFPILFERGESKLIRVN